MKKSNNQRLRIIMAQHDLTAADIASMLCVKSTTVRAWLLNPTASNWRPMSDGSIKFLRCLVKNK